MMMMVMMISGLLHVGDVIKEINGQEVLTPEQLQDLMKKHSGTITFKIIPSSQDFNSSMKVSADSALWLVIYLELGHKNPLVVPVSLSFVRALAHPGYPGSKDCNVKRLFIRIEIVHAQGGRRVKNWGGTVPYSLPLLPLFPLPSFPLHIRSSRNSDGVTPAGPLNISGVWKYRNFRPITRYISETAFDKHWILFRSM